MKQKTYIGIVVSFVMAIIFGIHPDADQVLLILDGEGFYQEEGKPKRLIKRGDVINTPANVKHWHGATQDSKLVHLSVTTKNGKNHIEWKELVKSNEYNL